MLKTFLKNINNPEILKSSEKQNYVNPLIPKDKKFDESHFTKWVLSDEPFQKGNGP